MKLITKHGIIELPTFFPDATRGVTKTVDSEDLNNVQIEGVVVNTFHLSTSHVLNLVKETGGIHTFMNWNKPVISDSGGFQVLSLVRENSKFGKIYDDKVVFKTEAGKKIEFTPEKSIQAQFKLNSDIMICFDDCTRNEDTFEQQELSVKRTIAWAIRSKEEFEKNIKNSVDHPLLFAVIQGGNNKQLRKQCAEALIKIGFDGYGFGGFPFNEDKTFDSDILKYTAELMPDDKPKYALGLGSPEHLVACYTFGYNIFDCVIPTRDARHKRLYILSDNFNNLNICEDKFYSYMYLDNEKMLRDMRPVSSVCDCTLCKNYSRAYLYHLFKIKDSLVYRLATIHNLRFYSMMLEKLKSYEN